MNPPPKKTLLSSNLYDHTGLTFFLQEWLEYREEMYSLAKIARAEKIHPNIKLYLMRILK